ncbi:MAG: response regulator transcription factor [Planctomycetes bacterium]|nr:response regulator transcription factor [Planctomycetota bacterium]
MADKAELLDRYVSAFARDGESKSCQEESGSNKNSNSGLDTAKLDSLLEKTLLKGMGAAKSLTKRESEILRLIVSGMTNKEIARKLCRAQRTVEYHRNRLMCKLKTRNMAELVKCAISMGMC